MDTYPIINKTYEIYKSLIILNGNLSKKTRYSLGMALENNTLQLMDLLILAKNAPKPMKSAYLLKASALLEAISLKLRLFLELKLANETNVFKLQEIIAETGRMLGGWLKAAQST